VLAQYNEKQDSQIKSLVKIYESMKPEEAAAIFNEMEMPILLDVIGKMSERKVALVLAGMNPKRARDVTQELADKRKKATQSAAAVGAN
jgi:flagellar motility protein MotE (MotC chaperone)